MHMSMNVGSSFICPECGSRHASAIKVVQVNAVTHKAWSSVVQMYRCGECNSVVPAELAERWDNRSPDDAQQEWWDNYRDSQPEWD